MPRFEVHYQVRVTVDLDEDVLQRIRTTYQLTEDEAVIFLASTLALDHIPLPHLEDCADLPADAVQISLYSEVMNVHGIDDQTES